MLLKSFSLVHIADLHFISAATNAWVKDRYGFKWICFKVINCDYEKACEIQNPFVPKYLQALSLKNVYSSELFHIIGKWDTSLQPPNIGCGLTLCRHKF